MKENIESQIIDMLIKGPLSPVFVVRSIIKEKGVTKEAVYKSLRQLLQKEHVVKSGQKISLSNQWVIKMADKWKQAEMKYIGKSNIQMLGDKSSVVYTCKTIDQLDSLWNHAILDILYTLNPKTTLLLYSPHYWFPCLRNTSEYTLMHTIKNRGHRWLQLAGFTKMLDKDLKKYFPLDEIEYHPANVNEKTYINVLGEYFIEVTLDKKANNYINKWYDKYSVFSNESITELEKVLKIKGVYKLKISKNKNKISKFKKIFNKYYLIK